MARVAFPFDPRRGADFGPPAQRFRARESAMPSSRKINRRGTLIRCAELGVDEIRSARGGIPATPVMTVN
ncbi:MAG: hypothetical protein BGP02_16705 [Pandoraea sp. 64-18]|nr:MAG: hypothetical protein BGP02_16705 [Pandoraea sp. 64-18]